MYYGFLTVIPSLVFTTSERHFMKVIAAIRLRKITAYERISIIF